MSEGGVVTDTPLITHIVGARPNFPKAAPVIRALAQRGAQQRLVHTGQHYDEALSESLIRDLNLPRPDVNLGVGSGTHAQQTASLLTAIEEEVAATPPALLVVYGDINSTLAAALVASKLGIPLAHVEAGLRSFDRTMPEEINRVLTDQLSTLLFTTSPEAHHNLVAEGIAANKIHFVGNPMIDSLLANRGKGDSVSQLSCTDISEPFAVVTLHRGSNVDDVESIRSVVGLLNTVSQLIPLVFPIHPRGRQKFEEVGISLVPALEVTAPLGYRDFLTLLESARLVITDSGGVQEEATVLGIPCLTLRNTTERPVTLTHGKNKLVSKDTLVEAVTDVLAHPRPAQTIDPPPLWDGHAGRRIAQKVMGYVNSR